MWRLADALDSGLDIKDITFIDGTVYKTKNLESVSMITSCCRTMTELQEDKKRYAESFFVQYSNTDPFSGKRLVEPYEGQGLCSTESACKAINTGGNG